MTQPNKQSFPDLPDPWLDQGEEKTFAPVVDLTQYRKKVKTGSAEKGKSKVNQFVPGGQQLSLDLEGKSNADDSEVFSQNIPTLSVKRKRRNFIETVLGIEPPKRRNINRGSYHFERCNCREKVTRSGKVYLSWYYCYRCPNGKSYSIYIPKSMERLIALMENNNELVIKILQVLGARKE